MTIAAPGHPRRRGLGAPTEAADVTDRAGPSQRVGGEALAGRSGLGPPMLGNPPARRRPGAAASGERSRCCIGRPGS